VQEGLLTVAAGMSVRRLAPPLIITEADADEALALLDRACRKMTPSTARVAAK
jgi:acetylornithine/N-succinyldiaminopimelate aminotransferase